MAEETGKAINAASKLEEARKAIKSREVFVPDRINELVELDDDPTFINETLGDFIDQVDLGLDEMDTFRKDKSFKELGEKAHFLKGSALALGCERLGHICETLQHLKAPDDEQLEVIDMCLIELRPTWEATLPFIEGYIAEEDDDEEGEEADEGGDEG